MHKLIIGHTYNIESEVNNKYLNSGEWEIVSVTPIRHYDSKTEVAVVIKAVNKML